MSIASSDIPRRYLAVWFPFLSTDRLQRTASRPGAAPADAPPLRSTAEAPLALVEAVKNAQRLSAVSPEAQSLGLLAGMTLADARARVPALHALPHDRAGDAALLAQVLEDFGRYTPVIAADGPDAVVLDVAGCAHLWGGEAGMMRAVRARCARLQLVVRLSLAGTPQAARALVRWGPEGRTPPGGDAAAVRPLPVAALELDDRATTALKRAGLKRLGDLDARPRAALAARFGADVGTRLDRVLGREDVRITPLRPPAPVRVDRRLLEPVTGEAQVDQVLADLAADAEAALEARGLGGRMFEVAFFRVDGAVRRLAVGMGRPGRGAAVLLRLLREKLAALPAPLDPGFGYDHLRLSVLETAPLGPVQAALTGEPAPEGPALGELIDRLSARLGPAAVLRFEARGSHLPERAQQLCAAQTEAAAEDADWPELDPEDPPLRPLQMFEPPQPITVWADAPDGPPLVFRWRRMEHRTATAEGPERIAPEWWRTPTTTSPSSGLPAADLPNSRVAPGAPTGPALGAPADRPASPMAETRDYYRVEDREGRRFWLFRAGPYGAELQPRWFVHGLFA